MNPSASPPAQRVLVERIDSLRDSIQRRIPLRFRALVSADDVLQDVWIAAHAQFEAVHAASPGAIDRWLETIARRKLIDALRAARADKRGGAQRFVVNAQRRMTSFSMLFARLQSPQRTPSRDVRAEEAAHTVGISLAALPDEHRRAIELRFVEGLSRREIAAQLHKSEASVNSLLFNALRRLRTMLGKATHYLSS
jgi:RNA polymerase sigma-70 factor, ECF subfamily